MVWVAFLFSFLTAGLSKWQFARLAWKEALVFRMKEEYAKKPQEDHQTLQEFRQVAFKGEWIQSPLFLQYKIHQHQIGCEVVLPFKHNNGAIFLVNRGWQKSCTVVESKNPVELRGIVRSFLDFPQGTPPNTPPCEWYYMNAGEMKNSLPVVFADTFYIDCSKGLPELPNNHLMYALTWAALSVVFFGMMFKVKKVKRPL